MRGASKDLSRTEYLANASFLAIDAKIKKENNPINWI
jgi:hypothetical protein